MKQYKASFIVNVLYMILVLCAFSHLRTPMAGSDGNSLEKGPYFQHLPNCNKQKATSHRISKKTKAKAIVCPMIRYAYAVV